jgi:multidrug transporter EmrE-like cation transporter
MSAPAVPQAVSAEIIRAHLFLAAAVVAEALWAVMLKVSQGFTVLWASLVMFGAYVLSLVFLNVACRHFDLGLAYAVWTGSGATLVALFGALAFREPVGPGRALGLVLVIAGVAVLLSSERRP